MTARPTRRWLPLLAIPIGLGLFVACNSPLPTTEQVSPPNTKLALAPLAEVEEVVIEGVPVREQALMQRIKLDLSMSNGETGPREVELVADSLIELRLDGSRQPLLVKETVGRQR